MRDLIGNNFLYNILDKTRTSSMESFISGLFNSVLIYIDVIENSLRISKCINNSINDLKKIINDENEYKLIKSFYEKVILLTSVDFNYIKFIKKRKNMKNYIIRNIIDKLSNIYGTNISDYKNNINYLFRIYIDKILEMVNNTILFEDPRYYKGEFINKNFKGISANYIVRSLKDLHLVYDFDYQKFIKRLSDFDKEDLYNIFISICRHNYINLDILSDFFFTLYKGILIQSRYNDISSFIQLNSVFGKVYSFEKDELYRFGAFMFIYDLYEMIYIKSMIKTICEYDNINDITLILDRLGCTMDLIYSYDNLNKVNFMYALCTFIGHKGFSLFTIDSLYDSFRNFLIRVSNNGLNISLSSIKNIIESCENDVERINVSSNILSVV